MNESLFNNNNKEYTTYYGKIKQYIMVKTIQYNTSPMIGESLLLLKGHSSCNKSYKIEYKATVMVFVIIVLTVHINTKKVTLTLIFS